MPHARESTEASGASPDGEGGALHPAAAAAAAAHVRNGAHPARPGGDRCRAAATGQTVQARSGQGSPDRLGGGSRRPPGAGAPARRLVLGLLRLSEGAAAGMGRWFSPRPHPCSAPRDHGARPRLAPLEGPEPGGRRFAGPGGAGLAAQPRLPRAMAV